MEIAFGAVFKLQTSCSLAITWPFYILLL